MHKFLFFSKWRQASPLGGRGSVGAVIACRHTQSPQNTPRPLPPARRRVSYRLQYTSVDTGIESRIPTREATKVQGLITQTDYVTSLYAILES